MAVVVITPPPHLVSLAEAKAHLRVDHSDDDLLIQTYVEACSEWIDGPAGWLQRAVGRQTLELRQCDFGCPVGGVYPLPFPPLVSITSMTYVDADGAEQTLPAETYATVTKGYCLANGASWPALRGDVEGVRIRYEAGYALVPQTIRAAVLLHVGELYEHRESVVVGATVADLPRGVEALLSPYRVWSL